MKYNVHRIDERYDFDVVAPSYIGNPKSNTVVFITKKIAHFLETLYNVKECLVFAEKGIEVKDDLRTYHCFVISETPQLEYAEFMNEFEREKRHQESTIKILFKEPGYYISETAVVGENAYIEPGCFIGHNVKIGNNARILYGSVIKNAVIGDNFFCNEYALIGANGFNMTEDLHGNKMRIPSLGYVIIGNNVEIGAYNNISCGSGGDTIIEDWVKIDAHVHLGHDVHLNKNTEITAGAVVGGFVETGEHSYIGINATIRNRLNLGIKSFVGMGAVVTKSVLPNDTVVGNPAKIFKRD